MREASLRAHLSASWDLAAFRRVLDVSRLSMLESIGRPPGKLLEAMLAEFQTTAPALVDELRAAVACQDRCRLEQAAHRLKGSAGHIGAVRLAATCAALEGLAWKDEQFLARSHILAVQRELQPVLIAVADLLAGAA